MAAEGQHRAQNVASGLGLQALHASPQHKGEHTKPLSFLELLLSWGRWKLYWN